MQSIQIQLLLVIFYFLSSSLTQPAEIANFTEAAGNSNKSSSSMTSSQSTKAVKSTKAFSNESLEKNKTEILPKETKIKGKEGVNVENGNHDRDGAKDPTRESTSKQTEDFDRGKISKNFPTSYFVIVFLLIGLIVVGFHNRRRILGLVIEGRNGSHVHGRRRYHRVSQSEENTTLPEAS